jgi:transposase-like protein
MALPKSVASERLEAFRAGEGVDLIRESVRLVMQDLIEVDVAEQIGAGRYERTALRNLQPTSDTYVVVASGVGD